MDSSRANSKKSKKVALIVAFKDFRDEEVFIPRSIFLREGFEVKVVSEKKGKALGVFGGVLDVDATLDEFQLRDFDAVVFCGGQGAAGYISNPLCHKICQDAVSQGKLLGAICIAPAILAKSGVLKSKKATVWHSDFDKSAVKILKDGGALFVAGQDVVVDGKIVTANGPGAARRFAQEISNLLLSEK